MSWLKKLVFGKLTSDRFDRRIGQWVCFVMSPALFFFGTTAVCRNSTTPAEITIGLLAAGNAALLVAVIGLLLPFTSPAWRRRDA